jgi:diguanylate cyclase (GGDEF)-like protein
MVDNVPMTSSPAGDAESRDRLGSTDEVDALHAAALALSEQLDPEEVLERIVERAAALVTGSYGYLYVVDEGEQQLVERVGQGPFAAFVSTTIGRDEGVAGLVWRTGKSHIENDYANWNQRRLTLGDATPTAVLGVPLVARGRTVGVIGLSHVAGGCVFTEADEALVSRFAQLASLAVERAELTAELQAELAVRRRTEEELLDTVARLSGSEAALRRTQEETVRRLSAAAEHRDGAIGRHIGRVSLYCDLIARRLGLDETFAGSIRIASPLHDIGKIGIPDHVLLKPGPLDDGERILIEQHAEIGYRILSGSESSLLDLAASIALTHHERWDGAGYPMRLRGQEIPLEGRIVAVADVYDALTSDRVYRAAFSPEAAIEILIAGRGTQFDPTALDAFLDLGRDALGAVVAEPSVAGACEPTRDRSPLVIAESTLTTAASADGGCVSAAKLEFAAHEAERELGRFSDGREAIDRALRTLCEEAGEHVLASVYVLEHDRLWCLAHVRYHQVRDGFDLGQGVMGRTLRTQTPQFVADVRDDPDFIPAVPGLVSEVALPLVGENARGVLNLETTNVRLPEESATILGPLARAMAKRADDIGSALRLDLTTLARLCVRASSLRTVEELSDFATRTLGRMLGLDGTQIALGEDSRSELTTTSFWRRPDSELEPLTSTELTEISAHLAAGDSAISVADAAEVGLSARDDPTSLVWLPLRVAGDRVGILVGRTAELPELDSEQTEAATLLAQQTAALIDVAQALRRERRAAVTDSLTGLLNRRGFDERLREEVGRATRTRRSLALVLIDCDDLKRINDGAGHEAGDRVIEACANLLRDQKRLTDIAGRLGGDEFALLLPETEADEAVAAAERLLVRLRSLGDTPVTASIGVAAFPRDGTTSSALLRAADRALYAAKHGGKNRLATPNVHELGRLAS